jgi:hypothetical protein
VDRFERKLHFLWGWLWLFITFDLDDLSGGIPKITTMPKESFSMKSPFRIDFAFKKNGATAKQQLLTLFCYPSKEKGKNNYKQKKNNNTDFFAVVVLSTIDPVENE